MNRILKITFNKPAFEAFFAGDDFDGVEFRVESGVLQIKPVFVVGDEDVAPIEERTRGGIEVDVVDYWQDEEVLQALRNPYGNPFFSLHRAGRGWFSAVPYDGRPRSEPPRTIPVMRVWTRPEVALSPEQMDRVGDMGVIRFVEEVRAAKRDVDAYYARKRPGRPPKDIAEKQALIRCLVTAAAEFMDVGSLLQAQRNLRAFGEAIGAGDDGRAIAEEIRRNPGVGGEVSRGDRRRTRS